MNGDGFSDVIVGAILNSEADANAGRAYVTLVYPYEVISPNGGERWAVGQPAIVRWRGHDVADLAISYDGGSSWTTLVSGIGGLNENEHVLTAPAITTAAAKVRFSYRGQTVARSTSDASDRLFEIVPPARPVACAQELVLGGAAADDFFGSARTAGDVNGDGFADLIAGAQFNDAGGVDAGRSYVYYGGSPDAVSDLVLTGEAAGDQLGACGTAGDVNGDGFDDVIVGAYANDAAGPDAGRAYVFRGGPGADAIPDLILTGAAGGDWFGLSVGTAGDVNGDGFADVIVGASMNDAAGPDAGRAYVYRGGPTADATADLTLTGASANDQFGGSVGTAGDVNGDGYADLIVGATGNDAGGANAGRAYVYHGGPGADATADLTLTGQVAGDQFGISVGTAGDVNGDGFADVIVGANFNDAGGLNAGRAYVYFGGPGADALADLTLTGEAAGDQFGASVGTAGDMNADGFADVIVGGRLNAVGGFNAGRAYLFHGGPVGDASADLVLTGAAVGDQFGAPVGTAGDVNGDGFPDLIVGATFNDAGGTNAGRAYVYGCNRYVVISPNGGETWNVGASRSITWLGAEPADLWLSVDGGGTYERLETAVGGSESNAVSVRVPHTPTRFARVKIAPSDPAVDGRDHSDSLFTIQTSVALLSLAASLTERGAELTWSSDPGVGPDGLAGYRLYRLGPGDAGNGIHIGPELITENLFTDADGAPGMRYRLLAVNGLGSELLLGEVALLPARALAAWPMPYRGGTLELSFATASALGGGTDHAEVTLHDVSGRRIRTIARGGYRVGYHAASWDGRDDDGRLAPAGLYFLRLRSAGRGAELKVVVLP